MRGRAYRRTWLTAALAAAVTLLSGSGTSARAASPPQGNTTTATSGRVELGTRLARGETVTYRQRIENADRRYVGGVTYTIVPADIREMDRMFEDVAVYTRVLPATQSARLVATRGRDSWVELQQGNSFMHASITLIMRREDDGQTVRFWIDQSRPHGVRDAWGFFRATPLEDDGRGPRTLLTYGALLDVGPGIVRTLFEGRLERLLLSVPQRIRAFESLRADGRRVGREE